MSLNSYFSELIKKVEDNNLISNSGKDDNGFYKPTRTVLLRHLNLLRDLYNKPRAREMVKASWEAVVKDIPPEWLVLNEADRKELKKILE